MNAPEETDSYAYILRLWRERPSSPGQAAVWRISLTDARSGERHGFGNAESLLAFLRAQMGEEQVRCDK